jgi:hypothetical protein
VYLSDLGQLCGATELFAEPIVTLQEGFLAYRFVASGSAPEEATFVSSSFATHVTHCSECRATAKERALAPLRLPPIHRAERSTPLQHEVD